MNVTKTQSMMSYNWAKMSYISLMNCPMILRAWAPCVHEHPKSKCCGKKKKNEQGEKQEKIFAILVQTIRDYELCSLLINFIIKISPMWSNVAHDGCSSHCLWVEE